MYFLMDGYVLVYWCGFLADNRICLSQLINNGNVIALNDLEICKAIFVNLYLYKNEQFENNNK